MRRGFTLVELIILLVLGSVLSALVVTIAQETLPHFGEETVIQVDRQYDMLQEIERLQSAYREQIESGSLNLASLLSGWTPGAGVTSQVSTVTVGASGGGFTYSTPIYRVRFSSGDYSMDAYFAQ